MLSIDPCTTLADFEAVHPMLAAMGIWDAGEAARFGVPEADTLAAYYSDTPADLMAAHTAARTAFYLARWSGETSGCGGYSRWSDEVAELKKVYVRPDMRGKGIARKVMEAVLAGMRTDGYGEACLVTTRFMPQAVALYSSLGFERTPPFEPLPPAFEPFTIFMRRTL